MVDIQVDVMDLVGHSVDSFTVGGFTAGRFPYASWYLDNGIVIEPCTLYLPIEISDVEFSSPEEFARVLESVGRKVLSAHYGLNLAEICVYISFGKSAKEPCFEVRTRQDLIRRR